MKKSTVVGIFLILSSQIFSLTAQAQKARPRSLSDKVETNRAAKKAVENAKRLSLVPTATKGQNSVQTDLATLEASKSAIRRGDRIMSQKELKQEAKAIEIYKAMAEEGNDLAAHLGRVLEANRAETAQFPLDPEGWGNFVTAAMEMEFRFLRNEQQLGLVLKKKGLDLEEVKGCKI